MKKFCWLIFISAIISVASAADSTAWQIYTDKFDQNAMLDSSKINHLTSAERYELMRSLALKDLGNYLKIMTSQEIEIVIGIPQADNGLQIIIGENANQAGARPVSSNREAFRLKINGKRILIGGNSPQAFSYGVYELLNRLGCDWVMPGKLGEIIPEKPAKLPAELDFESFPAFRVRAPWYSGTEKTYSRQARTEALRWGLRHKQQLIRFEDDLVMYGGHIWGKIIAANAEIFKAKPEMLALVRQVDGSFKRQGPQVETTHPEVIALFEKYIRNMFVNNKWPKDKTVCIGVGPADGGGYSVSSESQLASSGRIDPLSGSNDITDLQILLCNQLLERMEKEFPNLYLGFYLYSVHADYPMRYKPHPKIAICIADIIPSRLHGTLDPHSKSRAYYKDVLDSWGKLHREQGNPIMFRGYNSNLADAMLPYTKLKIWGEDIPYYHSIGVFAMYNECFPAWAVNAPSNYLEAELTWNIKADWHDVLKRYCRAAFGEGAAPMRQYYLTLAERQSSAGQEAGSFQPYHLIYDDDFIKKAESLFAEAEKMATAKVEKERIKAAALPVEMLKRFFDMRKAFSSYDYPLAEQRYLDLIKRLENIRGENEHLLGTNGMRYLSRFYGITIREGSKYSSGQYRIVHAVPEQLPSAFDSNAAGQLLNYYKPEVNDTGYLRTHTFSTTWDAQGLSGFNSGAIWYRIHMPLEREISQASLGLFLGCVNSVVRVWCNGKYIGLGAGFARPQLFDLTGMTHEGDNLIAVQVIRRGTSELGVGGISMPCFVFTGPRLASKAPGQENLKRLLPGGAEE